MSIKKSGLNTHQNKVSTEVATSGDLTNLIKHT